MSKYNNKKTQFLGILFDSKAEAYRYSQLLLKEKNGDIRGLERQVSYELAPGVKFEGAARKTPALRYVADFGYWEGDKRVIEDVKGIQTPAFKIKRHLMKTVLGLEVRLTK